MSFLQQSKRFFDPGSTPRNSKTLKCFNKNQIAFDELKLKHLQKFASESVPGILENFHWYKLYKSFRLFGLDRKNQKLRILWYPENLVFSSRDHQSPNSDFFYSKYFRLLSMQKFFCRQDLKEILLVLTGNY